MDHENISLLAGAGPAHVDKAPRIVGGSRSAEVRCFQVRGNHRRHEAAVGGPLAERQHRRNALSAGFILDQERRVARRVFRQILGQGSGDAILSSAGRGADLQRDGLAVKVRLLRGGQIKLRGR